MRLFAGDEGVCHRAGIKGIDLADYLFGTAVFLVYQGFCFAHFCGVCGSFARLCLRFLQCRAWFGKELIQQFACDDGELLFQFAGCGGLLDCQWMGGDDVAFVQGFCHTHQTDPGLSVSGKNGAFNGRGSPPAWQQRVVDVHTAEFWCVQYGAGKQSSVGDYDEEVCRKLAPSTRWWGVAHGRNGADDPLTMGKTETQADTLGCQSKQTVNHRVQSAAIPGTCV